MPLPLAEGLATALLVYAGIGVVFGLAFVTVGLAKVDPVARGASFGLRLLLLPGSAALWPLLALRWWKGGGAPEECSPHRAAARAPEGRP